MNRKFELGLTVMTKGIENLVNTELEMITIFELIDKHLLNESELTNEDLELNEYAIAHKQGRVFSSFTLENNKIYVITDGMELEEKDRVTTVLLAEEY